jgi:hypothetical protein
MNRMPQSDLQNAGTILNTALHRTMGESNKVLEAKGWKPNGFNLTNVTATESGGIRFAITFQFLESPEPPSTDDNNAINSPLGKSGIRNATYQTAVRANIPGNGQKRLGDGANNLRFYRTIYIEPNEVLASREELYNKAYSYLTSPTSIDKARLIWLTQEENDKLNLLFGGLGGGGSGADPTTISGGFWRMAYFSATVITTIGFGDIVPITPMARLTVAFEGVLGIALAGLFVNAATRQRPAGV